MNPYNFHPISWLRSHLEYWRFYAWFYSGLVLAVLAYNMSDIDAVALGAAATVLAYFSWRGYRAEVDHRGE